MTKLDAGLMTSLPASDSGSAAVWGSKRINPRPQSCLCLAWSGCPSNDDDDDRLFPFCPIPTYLGVKLDRSLTFRHHLMAFCKKLSSLVTLLKQLVGSGSGADAKTLRTAALSLVYSIAEYCAPVWCSSVHTRLTDSVLNDALRIITTCLRSTPTDHLTILSGIQPSELCRLVATVSMAHCGSLDPNHILYGLKRVLRCSPRKIKV